MTQEEKAKAYDEAIRRVQNIKTGKCEITFMFTEDLFEYVFPELKESEDERIRKWIRKELESKYVVDNIVNNVMADKALAWLEKQGEEKPADKVEPKFKVGDWITNGINVNKIIGINLENEEYLFENDRKSDISLVESVSRLWTIEDAKDGDVLHSIGGHNDCTFIFNGLDNWKFDEPNGDRAVATGYCCLFVSSDKMEFGIQGPDCVEVNTVKPATKTQRELLFQKMKEAGYEWDAEKKELKKIEQSTDEYIEVKGLSEIEAEADELTKEISGEKHNLTDFEKTLADICIGWIGEEPGWVEYIKDNADVLLKIAIKKFNSVQDAPFEQKPAWSDEDEEIHRKCICAMRASTCGFPEEEKFVEQVDNWLKSLKERCTWKPSDEQMQALSNAGNSFRPFEEGHKVLWSLYNDLKKLKDE